MSQGCLSFQNSPTRDGSCLDHVFSNINAEYLDCKILQYQITDHAMIDITIKLPNTHVVSEESVTRFTNEKKFVALLRKGDWDWAQKVEENDQISVNDDFDLLVSIMQECRARATKTKILKDNKRSGLRKKRQPWMTTDLLSLIDKKMQVYQRYRHHSEDITLKTDFKLISARVKKEIRKEKVKYYSKLLDDNNLDAKKYWEIINETRGKNRKARIKEIVIDDEKVATEEHPSRVAEEFYRFCNSVTDNLIEKAGMNSNHAEEEIRLEGADPRAGVSVENGGGQTLDGFRLTTGDVHRAILSLKNKFSVGADGVSSRTIKEMANLFSKISTPLFNKSLKQCVFPDKLKLAFIVPVFKSGDDTQMTNYRPISLLPCISKVFEKCVKMKIQNHLDHIINFLSDKQFGFVKNKSTDTLFTHISSIVDGIEAKNAVLRVYLDLAKAFNTINHRILIKKLGDNVGFRGPLLGWFASYLSKRKYCVKMNNTTSSLLEMKHGVLQGSVFGPLLFVIYMNNILKLPLNGTIIAYADDTSMLCNAATVMQINEDFAHKNKIK